VESGRGHAGADKGKEVPSESEDRRGQRLPTSGTVPGELLLSSFVSGRSLVSARPHGLSPQSPRPL
jgi:hypothetical protein